MTKSSAIAGGNGGGDGPRLTIDEVARTSGMTVRNVRAYQSRGLLPPPEVRGRTGYYGPDHLARLELIRQLQAEGFNLAAIKRVLARTPPGAAEPTLEFDREVRRPWQVEQPEVVAEEDLAARFGGAVRPDLTRDAVRLGLLVEAGGGRYEVPSPRLLAAAEDLVRMGIPVEAVLEVARGVTRHADAIARRFVDLFVERIWQPFEAAGRPEDDWPRIGEALERLRPLALEAVDALIRQALEEATEAAYARVLRGDAGGRGRRRRSGRV